MSNPSHSEANENYMSFAEARLKLNNDENDTYFVDLLRKLTQKTLELYSSL